MPDLRKDRSDIADHRDRMRRARHDHSEAMAATRNALTKSRELLTEIDAMLAKGNNVFIEEYFRKDRIG